MKKINSVVLLSAITLTGCISISIDDKASTIRSPITITALDGEWTGSYKSDLATGQTNCGIDGPMRLFVKNGILHNSPTSIYKFTAPIRYDGYVKFIIKNAIRMTNQEIFMDYKVDWEFIGWLEEDNFGGGDWHGGACHGTWIVWHSIE